MTNSACAGSVFVGRQREMALLQAALEEALSGQGRLVMLVGEPGIGKTRTAQELATYAGLRQCQVLWGRCYEGQGAPPYWPWVQAIRGYVQEHEDGDLRSQMGSGAADIAEIVSDVKERLPDLKPPPKLEPEQARFRLFDSIAGFLKGASREQPLVVVLDDLHWADQPSLLLLQFVARDLGNSRVLLLGAYRDMEVSRQHPLAETLAQLSREPIFRRVPLLGLSREDTQPFIQATAGMRPAPSTVEIIYRRTEGNPFFMGEVIRLLSDQGGLTGEEAGSHLGTQVPEGVREAIGQRLNRLSKQCSQALTTASIIGREFDFKLLRTLRGEAPEDQLLEAVDEALEAHLIEELPGATDRYQFNHALVQQTLAEQLSTSRRVRLHARIGQALEEQYGVVAEAHAAELAYHFGEAASVLGPEKLVRYSLLAGELALGAYAWEDAVAHFQRGLVAKGVSLTGSEPAKDGEAAALLFGLGRARAGTAGRQELQEAVDSLGRAFDYYEDTEVVGMALAVAQCPVPTANAGRTGVARFIPRALKLVPPDSLAAGRLLATWGNELGRIDNDYNGAQQALGRALAIARREGDLALVVRALVVSADTHFFHLRLQESQEEARQAIELARGLEDHQAAWSAHFYAARTLWLMGESKAAQQHISAALELAEKLHHSYRLSQSLLIAAALHRELGNWQRVRELSDRSLAATPRDNALLAGRVRLEYELGEFGRGAVYLQRLLETVPKVLAARPGTQYALPAQVIPWVARITGELNLLDVAAAAGQTVLSSPFSTPYFVYAARAGLGLVAVLSGDGAAAEEHYHHLKPWRGLLLQALSSDHVLGLLSRAMGDLDQAAQHFEDALVFCRKAGYRTTLAWSCSDYADCLLAMAQQAAPLPGDRQKAMLLLDESLAIARELGMKPLMERVLRLQERAESLPARAPAYPNGLTQREVEVLRLIASGKTDRQIAEELFISVTTASTHVRNLLNKTNTANRAEATAYAAQHALI